MKVAENQMGTMRKVQGAKEHALANIAINAAHNCRLYSTWIDITKAFDSVDHVVLEHVIRRLKLPNWMTNFILDTIKRWAIDISQKLGKVHQHKPPLPSTQRAGRRYSHASLITTYLHDKYGLTIRDNEAIPKTIQHLRKLQNRSLYNVISTTKLHKLLFSRRELDSVDLEESTLWLRKSMLTPQEEAKLINLQDRNLQWMSSKKNHKKCGKYLDVEHLASKCDRLLHTDYVRRHNEVARRIHRTLAKELGVKNIKKVERYKIDDRKFTKNGWISYDMSIHTEKKVQFNRPDIIVADNARTASP
ncbi:reverse transcriptase domain containing protein [Babesia caballi]|uniref:Reverse transcriptase domain containing protein n=1 Tax=Babesia caballi TaxID=5871 RepID=A0AAV4M596_BABCB|nr:reverse transcriptase domain containing protein [Babesia caballi]